ncbi:MAG: precorrin-2 C(20)-methyltransferase [Deltaproteobacteria bacterium]|nr:MAG: precorrin-2 C(20)-methyltransferase [Deltaproteobacteria bacterium]
MNSARLYAVGVGPGDPELLTLKAVRILRAADVIVAPTGQAEAASYALGIVAAHLDPNRQQVLERVFPMSRDEEELRPYWEATASEVAAHVRAGRTVAFVTIGDPLLYSTFLYLLRLLRERYPEIAVEIVPGITSVSAAAAAAGVPLATAAERVAVLPATYEAEKLRQTLLDFDCTVLLKVSRVFDQLYALLVELGLERRGVFIRRVGSSEEEVVTDLASLVGKKLDYLSLLIVRKG